MRIIISTMLGHIIGISMICVYLTGFIVGIMNITECPIDIYIPIWLLGKLPLFTLCYILYCYTITASDEQYRTMKFMICWGITVPVEIIWQLAGTFNLGFIYKSYNGVNTESWQYCNQFLFYVAFVIMLITWLFYVIFFIYWTKYSKGSKKSGTNIQPTADIVTAGSSKNTDNVNELKNVKEKPKRLSKAEIKRIHKKSCS